MPTPTPPPYMLSKEGRIWKVTEATKPPGHSKLPPVIPTDHQPPSSSPHGFAAEDAPERFEEVLGRRLASFKPPGCANGSWSPGDIPPLKWGEGIGPPLSGGRGAPLVKGGT